MTTREGKPADSGHTETSWDPGTSDEDDNECTLNGETTGVKNATVKYVSAMTGDDTQDSHAVSDTGQVSGIASGCSTDSMDNGQEERAASPKNTNEEGVKLSPIAEMEDNELTENQIGGERKEFENHVDDNINDQKDHTDVQKTSLLNNPQVRHDRSSKKHVVWQMSREMEVNVPVPFTDTQSSNPAPDCTNVDPGVQTDPLSPSVSRRSPVENNGIKERENHISSVESENLTSGQGMNNQEFSLSVQKDKGSTERNEAPGCRDDTLNVDKKGESAVNWTPSTQVRRDRPLSANAVCTRERKLGRDKWQSDDALRPSSATAAAVSETRRFSLPLEISERVRNQPLSRILWDGKKERTPQSVNSPLDDPARNAEKQNGRGVLVTHSEQERINSTENRKDSTRVTKTPPRSPSAKYAGQPRRRPATATGLPARVTSSRPPRRPLSHLVSSGMGPPRPWDLQFGKDELQRALPRRNFFNCHNKALKDAGFEVEEENARPRRKRLLFFHHEDDDDDAKPPPPVIREPFADEDKEKEQDNVSKDDASDNIVETAVNMLSVSERTKRRKSQIPVVDCKPLQQYLTYVRDNPADYRHMVAKHLTSGASAVLHPSSLPADNCHTARLVSLGRIFQERQSGGQRADEVLRAAYSLNPRAADPNRFAKPARDKSPLLQNLISRKQSTIPNLPRKESSVSGEEGSKSGQRSKPGSEDRQRHETERAAVEHLTEVEKRRLKAEDWARTITTDQLVRAKLQVLKELGHEERELSQWWLAFRTCFYLRPKIRE